MSSDQKVARRAPPSTVVNFSDDNMSSISGHMPRTTGGGGGDAAPAPRRRRSRSQYQNRPLTTLQEGQSEGGQSNTVGTVGAAATTISTAAHGFLFGTSTTVAVLIIGMTVLTIIVLAVAYFTFDTRTKMNTTTPNLDRVVTNIVDKRIEDQQSTVQDALQQITSIATAIRRETEPAAPAAAAAPATPAAAAAAAAAATTAATAATAAAAAATPEPEPEPAAPASEQAGGGNGDGGDGGDGGDAGAVDVSKVKSPLTDMAPVNITRRSPNGGTNPQRKDAGDVQVNMAADGGTMT